MIRSIKSWFDIPLVTITAVLVVLGLIMIYDATPVTALRDFGDKLYYFKNQLIWATLGFFALIFMSFFDYHRLLKLSPLILGVCVLFLIAVLIPGIGTKVYGSRRWINIAGFSFQPSELAKISLILYTTAIMVKFEKYKIAIKDAVLVFFLPAFTITGLTLLQPDFGTALIIIGCALVIYFVGKSPIRHFLIGLPFFISTAVLAIILEPYRLSRIKSFLDPTHDPQGASYQIYQILLALSSGGFFGQGLGGSYSKFNYIPEIQGDAIFAILIEEFGFVGAVIMVGLFLVLIFRGLKIAKSAPDFSGRVLATGITGFLAIQIFFNIASVVALVPLTGVPLPFISYGGSSLFVTLASIGILLNIKKASWQKS